MDMKISISQDALESLSRIAHPPFECPFCDEWKLCATCNAIEATALNWHVHMINEHWEEIAQARVAAVAGGHKTAYKYFHARLTQISAERCEHPDNCEIHDTAADEQETTDASGD